MSIAAQLTTLYWLCLGTTVALVLGAIPPLLLRRREFYRPLRFLALGLVIGWCGYAYFSVWAHAKGVW
jgi:hypothetical protein